MKYYYIPLCSKDFAFENIFSTESISPICFYERRGFGIDYFYKIPGFNLNEALVLFNSIPKYDDKCSGEAIKFILSINKNEINSEDIIVIDEDIIAIQKTIYLRKENFKVLFFSEKEMRIVLSRAEASLPTKPLKKFLKNFELLDYSLTQEVNVEKLKDVKIDLHEIDNQISVDRRINFFKGFIYGLVVGLISTKEPDETRLKRLLQEIINAHAEEKNKLQNKKISEPKFLKSALTNNISYQKVKQLIDDAEKIFLNLFPAKKNSEDQIVQTFFELFKSNLESFEDARRFINYAKLDDEIFGTNKFFKIINLLSKKLNNPPSFLFETLRETSKKSLDLTSTIKWDKKIISNDTEDDFKDSIYKLNSFVEKSFTQKSRDAIVNIDPISYSLEKNEIYITNNFRFLQNQKLFDEYIILSNIIIKKAKREKGDVRKEDLLEIIDEAWYTVSTAKGEKKSLLHQYLNNEINSYSLEKVSSVVTKNFVAFIFNPQSLENLEKYLEAKEINNKWIAYSYWCAFNGFANISRNFIKPVFDLEDSVMQNYLDNYFAILIKSSTQVENEKPLSSVVVGNASIPNKDEQFFETFLNNKFKISLSDFLELKKISTKDEKFEMLKKLHVGKRDAKKIIDYSDKSANESNLFD